MRNLNVPKLCNVARLRVRVIQLIRMQRNTIEPKILSSTSQGSVVFIPRIPMITDYVYLL